MARDPNLWAVNSGLDSPLRANFTAWSLSKTVDLVQPLLILGDSAIPLPAFVVSDYLIPWDRLPSPAFLFSKNIPVSFITSISPFLLQHFFYLLLSILRKFPSWLTPAENIMGLNAGYYRESR